MLLMLIFIFNSKSHTVHILQKWKPFVLSSEYDWELVCTITVLGSASTADFAQHSLHHFLTPKYFNSKD